MEPSFDDVVGAIQKSGERLHVLRSAAVAVAASGARIAAIAFDRSSPCLTWNNPELFSVNGGALGSLEDGVGGDRLWFGPESLYFWHGPPDWARFSNYRVPVEMDPGRYEFTGAARGRIVMSGPLTLEATDNSTSVHAKVTRTVALEPSPISVEGLQYVGLKITEELWIEKAIDHDGLDIWRLLQIPPGSVLIVPLNHNSTAEDAIPQVYTGTANHWTITSDHLLWRYTGEADTKQGLSVRALIGRIGVLQYLKPDEWTLIVMEVPMSANGHYIDFPYGNQRYDQALQIWDGHGFGEIEHRSVGLGGRAGHISESHRLWAFGGKRGSITSVARELLGIHLDRAFDLAASATDWRRSEC